MIHTEIDDGLRENSIHLVGGSASLAMDSSGGIFVAYADQTDNDLILAWKSTDGWDRTTLLDDGALGSFSSLDIAGRVAYVSTYKRARNSSDEDISQIVVHLADLDELSSGD